MHFDLLLMTSRSGSSMVAEIFVKHGFYWAKDERRNPLVGGQRGRYNSFENQAGKEFLKVNFGTPLGDMITFTDEDANRFKRVVQNEYTTLKPNVWKGAVEFFPIWWRLHEIGAIPSMSVSIIYRNKEAVIESVLAKRQGSGNIDEARRITDKRYDIMEQLAVDYALPLIMTDELIAGDFFSLRQAFDMGGHGLAFEEHLAREVIKPEKWETER